MRTASNAVLKTLCFFFVVSDGEGRSCANSPKPVNRKYIDKKVLFATRSFSLNNYLLKLVNTRHVLFNYLAELYFEKSTC